MNIFITGGSRGIGRSIVRTCAAAGYGCAFTYAGNRKGAEETEELVRQDGSTGRVISWQMDVRDSAQVENTVERAIDELENIGAVVNNAGIVRNNAAALMEDDEWNEVIETNLSGPFYVIRSFLMHFISNRFGRIINISSLAQDGASGQINYAASKAGLIGMTRTLSREYGPKGITCNIVTVGLVETDMVRHSMSEDLKSTWLSYCPMKRLGTAEEIASAVHYLTTPEAGFINGEVLRVSGGLTYVP